jgi:hypothetical protein
LGNVENIGKYCEILGNFEFQVSWE